MLSSWKVAASSDDSSNWQRLASRAVASTASPMAVILCPYCHRKVARVVAVDGESVLVGQVRLGSSFEPVALPLDREIPSATLTSIRDLLRTHGLPDQALTSCVPCGLGLTVDRLYVKIMSETGSRKYSRICAMALGRPPPSI